MSDFGEEHALALGHNLECTVPLDRLGSRRWGRAARPGSNSRGSIFSSGGTAVRGEGGFDGIESRSISLLGLSHVVADFDWRWY